MMDLRFSPTSRRFLPLAAAIACVTLTLAESHAQSRAMSRLEVEALHRELSNWGRWGADNQLGALNLIRDGVAVEPDRLVLTADPKTQDGGLNFGFLGYQLAFWDR